MRCAARDCESGQTVAEYALMLGGRALVCVVGVLLVGDRVSGLFRSTAQPIIIATTSQGTPQALTVPSTVADCENDGWRRYPQFASESDCLDFVAQLPWRLVAGKQSTAVWSAW
jgi:Flp pilus assembly pilin Flp